jgi:hypothetical protein
VRKATGRALLVGGVARFLGRPVVYPVTRASSADFITRDRATIRPDIRNVLAKLRLRA